MSFQLPSVKSKPGLAEDFGMNEGSFGVPDVLSSGMSSARTTVDSKHPVMVSEANYRPNLNKMNMALLRNTQGLHAPLRIAMELKSAKKVGHLPFLQSSNVMYDSLTGRDIEMDVTDVFNTGEFLEQSNLPHAVMERSLGLF